MESTHTTLLVDGSTTLIIFMPSATLESPIPPAPGAARSAYSIAEEPRCLPFATLVHAK